MYIYIYIYIYIYEKSESTCELLLYEYTRVVENTSKGSTDST